MSKPPVAILSYDNLVHALAGSAVSNYLELFKPKLIINYSHFRVA